MQIFNFFFILQPKFKYINKQLITEEKHNSVKKLTLDKFLNIKTKEKF